MLDDVNDDSAECASQIKIILPRGNRQVAFMGLPYFALLTLRGNLWMDDTPMGHGLGLLAREHPDVGIINPNFSNMHSREDGFKRIKLCCLHSMSMEVTGVLVFDFGSRTRGITVFDPLQASNSKYYDKCEDKINEYFAEFRTTMTLKRETSSRQPDTASCGPAVLAFFERHILGIQMFRNQFYRNMFSEAPLPVEMSTLATPT
ncbi:Cysteine protease [Phytophthora megakarya]|uniref:Cysteine protease n=1 Tax=Phytophthora megakarya TaxID=4795 RepID=A0A225VJH9_9STRA|nr:Cysteine protease [Phytophthora megakarya]